MMAKITFNDNKAIITIEGIRKLLTLKSRIIIPINNIIGATADPGVRAEYPNFTKKVKGFDGVGFFGLYTGGTFIQDGSTVFWDVKNPENAIVITLRNEKFSRLILEVNDPARVVSEIERKINS